MTDENENAATDEFFDQFETDEAAERAGIWLRYPGERRIKIAFAGDTNKEYARRERIALKPYRRMIESGGFNNSKIRELLIPIYADLIVIDWQNVTLVKGGDPVACTPENVKALFKALPRLFDDIAKVAVDYTAFKALGNTDDDVKN